MGNYCCRLEDNKIIAPKGNKYICHNIEDDYTPSYPRHGFLCTICIDETDMAELEAAICGHTFHKKCLRAWWKKKYTCPTCGISMHS
jgi:hypothetical protein